MLFAVPVLIATGAIHCKADPESCDDATVCEVDPGPVDGGDAASDAVSPPGCDLTKGPRDSAACLDDAVGVFVSPNGDDRATGGKAAPVKTIGRGVELASGKGLHRVYVCEGTYGEVAEIKSAVALFGGLSCAWAYTGTKPKVAPAKGIAFKITGVTGPVLVRDIEISGTADPNAPGDSAIAAFVANTETA